MRYPAGARLITKMIGVVVGNNDYSKRREDPGFEGFSDLDATAEDMVNAERGMASLGVDTENDIIRRKNATWEDFREVFDQVTMKCGAYCQQALDRGDKATIGVMFYYAGHGLQDNTTYALCN